MQLVIGLFLLTTTLGMLNLLHDTAHNQIFGWLSLSGIGVGMSAGLMFLVVIIFGADIFWVLFLVIWLVRKKLHIESTH